MKTLLDLFFKPYLKFLFKFNLAALGVMIVIILSGIPEVLSIAPFLYFFGLYSTSNRHQFKDNISWMMASFSKKTLMGYHLLSQTMILVLQVVLAVGIGVIFIACVIHFVPGSTDVMPKAVNLMSSPEIQDSLIDTQSSYFSRKETLVSLIAFVFFLITMYSPISMKEYLKSIEEKRSKNMMLTRVCFALVAFVAALAFAFKFDPKDYLLIILSAIVVAELCYVAYIYNKVFILFHPRYYLHASGVAVMLLVSFTTFNYMQSLKYFRHGKSAEGRLQELMFLGVLAPKIDSSYFDKEFSDLKNQKLLVQYLRSDRYKDLISTELIVSHVMKSDNFSIAVNLLSAIGDKRQELLAKKELWAHLNSLYKELHNKNQASAFWAARTFSQDVQASKWKPLDDVQFNELNELEQLVTLSWYKKNDSKKYGAILSQGLDPHVEDAFNGKMRAPASSDLK